MGSKVDQSNCVEVEKTKEKKKWQQPKLEDVYVKVMSQPYIRFT